MKTRSPHVRPRRNPWSRAADMASRTPDTRNRYVDFLRALSIGAVISGHWMMASPHLVDGQLNLTNLLSHRPWTQWLTWLFQVMPVFFIVGGYANGVSWDAAVRKQRGYAEWLGGRLRRLLGPVLPLVAVWAILGVLGHSLGARPELVEKASQMALIPIWFLAVYVMAVMFVPLTHRAWLRFGMASFWGLAAATAADDLLFFGAGLRSLGWLNYAFIWFAVHQLGYAWRAGRLAGPMRALGWAAGGILLLVLLVTVGPYPLSMVSVPGEAVSNTLPPKLPMLALGIAQYGLLLSLEKPLRRWLARAVPWTATVLVNGMIMTIYLWHMTAYTLLVGVALALGGTGLTLEPGSGAWWAIRPVWIAASLAALAVLSLAFSRFERSGGGMPVAAWRMVFGGVLTCGGLALMALGGVGSAGWLGLRVWVVLMPFVGAAMAGVSPFRRQPELA